MAERHRRIGRTMPVVTAVRADAGNGRADDEHLTFRPVRNGLPEPAPWQRRADPASPAAGDERQPAVERPAGGEERGDHAPAQARVQRVAHRR